jgi:hypothetical protein
MFVPPRAKRDWMALMARPFLVSDMRRNLVTHCAPDEKDTTLSQS